MNERPEDRGQRFQLSSAVGIQVVPLVDEDEQGSELDGAEQEGPDEAGE